MLIRVSFLSFIYCSAPYALACAAVCAPGPGQPAFAGGFGMLISVSFLCYFYFGTGAPLFKAFINFTPHI